MKKNILHIAIEALAIPSHPIGVCYNFLQILGIGTSDKMNDQVFLQKSDFLEHVTRLVGNQKTFPFSIISDIVRSRR